MTLLSISSVSGRPIPNIKNGVSFPKVQNREKTVLPNLKEYTDTLNAHPEYLELVHNRELVSKETIYKLAHRDNSPIVKKQDNAARSLDETSTTYCDYYAYFLSQDDDEYIQTYNYTTVLALTKAYCFCFGDDATPDESSLDLTEAYFADTNGTCRSAISDYFDVMDNFFLTLLGSQYAAFYDCGYRNYSNVTFEDEEISSYAFDSACDSACVQNAVEYQTYVYDIFSAIFNVTIDTETITTQFEKALNATCFCDIDIEDESELDLGTYFSEDVPNECQSALLSYFGMSSFSSTLTALADCDYSYDEDGIFDGNSYSYSYSYESDPISTLESLALASQCEDTCMTSFESALINDWLEGYSYSYNDAGEYIDYIQEQCDVMPTPAPTGSCLNDPTWYKGDTEWKDCDWVARKANKRCSKSSDTSVLASDACLEACGCAPTMTPTMAPTSCEDDPDWYKAGNPAKHCSWVASSKNARRIQKRCEATGSSGSAYDNCRATCGAC